ncbi:glutamate--cysteine ligase regulatory subunit [Anoplophora glabripennis]|uniref:glutamate--cysteine ligase regulatory subunit n=1 Tax=Anoplophora glabripennis TaxID=217634 RepID=UPI000874D508|nr:glutamate--cysteine ligase regulatory subunit [Anoplophora glabripennis]
MANHNLEDIENVIINTGNILSINDITKKPNPNPTEELVEAINITIKDFQNGSALDPQPDHLLVINRNADDLTSKVNEHELSELKIGLKIFVNNDDQNLVQEAIEKAFLTIKVNSVDDVIISFTQKQAEDKKDDLNQIQNVWKILEGFVQSQKIKQLGIADVEENTFRALYEWAAVKPSIIQINLATCCVVPPTLQAFCKENDLKLLTHSDNNDILPKDSIQDIFGRPLTLKWALRFVIHVKCRGVLITKGYLLNLVKN